MVDRYSETGQMECTSIEADHIDWEIILEENLVKFSSMGEGLMDLTHSENSQKNSFRINRSQMACFTACPFYHW
jgi:hypothetical protein